MRLPFCRPVLVTLLLLLPGRATADSAARRTVAALLQPDRIEQVTLSPDGRHLAYVVHEGPLTAIKVRNVDPPEGATTIFADMAQTKGWFQRRIVAAVGIPFLAWAPGGTLVYAVARPSTHRSELNEEVHVVDADGHNDRILLDSEALVAVYMSPTATQPVRIPRHGRVLGFSAIAEDSFLVEAIGNALVPTEVFQVNIRTGGRETIARGEGPYRFLYDAAGKPRVRENPRIHLRVAATRSAPPVLARQRFEYHAPAALARWRPLDDLAPLGFSHDDQDYFRPRSFPLGFAADPTVLYFASDVGRDAFGIYALNLATGQRTDFRVESDASDVALPADAMTMRPLVLDRRRQLVGVRLPGDWPTTRWFDPALARLQQLADAEFPARAVRLVDWNDAKTRVLMLVTGPSDPGRYFVFDQGPVPEFTEMLRCRNVPAADAIATAEPFALTTPAGMRLFGTVTLPPRARLKPPPLVILCPDVPGTAPAAVAFDPEAQAIASAGFMVVRIAYRGTSGLGRRHRDAIQAGFDRVPLEDVRATLTWLNQHHPYNRPRVALVGRGFGGYIALRGLELFPGEFRVGVAIDGATDPLGWAHDSPWAEPLFNRAGIPSERSALRRAFFASAAPQQLESIALGRDLGRVRDPVLLIQTPAGMNEDPAARRLRNDLRERGQTAEYENIEPTDTPGETAARVLLRVVEFLNAHVYDYRVDVGKEREVK